MRVKIYDVDMNLVCIYEEIKRLYYSGGSLHIVNKYGMHDSWIRLAYGYFTFEYEEDE